MFREFRLSLPLPPPSFLRLSVRLFLPILFFISPTLSIVVWGKNMELRPGMFVFVDGKRSRVNRTQTRSKVAGKEYAREFCVHCSRWKQTQVEELLLKFVQHRIIIFLSTNRRFFLSPPKKKRTKTIKKNEIEIELWKIRFICKIFLLLSRRHAARIFENIWNDR